jgi:hypothetical protein
MLGLLVGLQDSCEVKSNRESGYGRYDVMLIPKAAQETSRSPDGELHAHASCKGVIIEFKKTLRGETLESAVEAALQQIEAKDTPMNRLRHSSRGL